MSVEIDPAKDKLKIEVEEGADVTVSAPRPKNENLGHLPYYQKPRRALRRGKSTPSAFSIYDLTVIKVDTHYESRDITLPIDTPELGLAFLNAPLADSGSLWKTKYKKIEGDEATAYRISIGVNGETPKPLDDSNALWKGSGLAVPNAITRLVFNGFIPGDSATAFYENRFIQLPMFPAVLDTDNTLEFKLTSLPTFGADAVTFALEALKPVNLFLSPALFALAATDISDALPETSVSSPRNNLPYPAYRWIFNDGRGCAIHPTGSPGYYTTRTLSGGTRTPSLLSRIRAWDRAIALAHNIVTVDTNILYANAVASLVLMHESKVIQEALVDEVFYGFGRQDGGFTVGQLFCGDFSGMVDHIDITNHLLSDAGHGNLYLFNSDSEITISGSLLFAVNQGERWFYLWRI